MRKTLRYRTHRNSAITYSPVYWLVGAGLLLACIQGANAQSAPKAMFYVGMEGECCGEDPHPVHGHPTPDGGYVVGGKSIDAGQEWQGFAVKVGPESFSGTERLGQEQEKTYQWAVTFGSDGQRDAVNSVAPLGDAVFIAGLKSNVGGTGNGYLAKHDLYTGKLRWDLMLASDVPGTARAIEVLERTADGGLYVAGLTRAAPEALEGFKSYGNPTDGVAELMYFDSAQLTGDQAPSGPKWTKTFESFTTIKGVRVLPQLGDGVIVLAHHEDAHPTLIRLAATGEIIWQQAYADAGEPTDLVVLDDNGVMSGFAFTGHGGTNESLDGFAIKVSPNGELQWKAVVGDPTGGVGQFAGLGPGNPKLIFDECWSITTAPNGGMLLGCGTGIEGCDLWAEGSAIRQECDADPRKTWRAFLTRLDKDGAVVWQRTDSFQPPNEDEVSSSASEFVSRTADGGWMSVVDEAFGIGIMVLTPESDSGSTGTEQGGEALPSDEEELRPDDDSRDDNREDAGDVKRRDAVTDEPTDGTANTEEFTSDGMSGEEGSIQIVGTPGCTMVAPGANSTQLTWLLLLSALAGLGRGRFRSS